MGRHEEGVEFDPAKHRIRVFTCLNIQLFLQERFRDVAPWRRDMIVNQFRNACEAWFIRGGGDPAEFEQLFDNQKNTRK